MNPTTEKAINKVREFLKTGTGLDTEVKKLGKDNMSFRFSSKPQYDSTGAMVMEGKLIAQFSLYSIVNKRVAAPKKAVKKRASRKVTTAPISEVPAQEQ